MAVTLGVIRETATDEHRVALTPEVAKKLEGLGVRILLEKGAGDTAFLPDDKFSGDNLELCDSAESALGRADLVFKVQAPNPNEISQMRAGTMLVAAMNPTRNLDAIRALRDRKITCWATEYIPRISRAQAMDTLSSQAAVAGYLGVLKAATLSAKFFPMLTTAAGTIRPSKVLVLGAGVAGLQAIATARRLGAMVEAYDIRPETKEQCESLGAKFVDTGIDARGEGGYARELTDEEKAKQKEIVDTHIAKADCIITTAAIPGRPSPKLIDKAAVEAMQPGSVIVDLASEGGGNCELTQPGETITHTGVTIAGPLNVPSELALHASEMFSKNLFNFSSLLIKEDRLEIDWDDEILAKACLTHDGTIKNDMIRKLVEES